MRRISAPSRTHGVQNRDTDPTPPSLFRTPRRLRIWTTCTRVLRTATSTATAGNITPRWVRTRRIASSSNTRNGIGVGRNGSVIGRLQGNGAEGEGQEGPLQGEAQDQLGAGRDLGRRRD